MASRILGDEDNYYAILGVAPNATIQTIREAYRRLALRLHPDKNPNTDTTEAFQRLGRAWEELQDPDKRAAYNRRRVDRAAQQNNAPPPPPPSPSEFEPEPEPAEPAEPTQTHARPESQISVAHPPITRTYEQRSIRREELREKYNEQRAHAQYSTRSEAWYDPNKELPRRPWLSPIGKWNRNKRIRKWKEDTSLSFSIRLQEWSTSRSTIHAALEKRDHQIKELQSLLRACRLDSFYVANPINFMNLFESSSNPVSGHIIESILTKGESMEYLDIPERVFVAKSIEAHYEECESLSTRLEHERRQFESDEYGARKQVVREAFQFIGPLTKSKNGNADFIRRKLWTLLDFIKPAINHYCPTKGDGATEGPWHNTTVAISDERHADRDFPCARCTEPAFKMHKNAAKCKVCNMLVCMACHADLRVLAMFQDWLEGRETTAKFVVDYL